jgi:hypothetical protein
LRGVHLAEQRANRKRDYDVGWFGFHWSWFMLVRSGAMCLLLFVASVQSAARRSRAAPRDAALEPDG